MNLKTSNIKSAKSGTFGPVLTYIKKMQSRERFLAIAAIGIGIFIAGNEAITAIQETFKEQEVRLEKSLSEMDLTSAALSRFATLKLRQRSIEDAYKEVEMDGPVLSYLEKLLKEKAGIASGFTIRDKPSRQFGGGYEQTPYTIKFTTVDLPRLLEFLKELSEGRRPVLLASIDIKPRPAHDSVDVELEISSIKHTRNSGTNS